MVVRTDPHARGAEGIAGTPDAGKTHVAHYAPATFAKTLPLPPPNRPLQGLTAVPRRVRLRRYRRRLAQAALIFAEHQRAVP
jgi:hypothetical protein